jgi:hypothetical protein
VPEILRDAGSWAAFGATAGILLLLPLYISQRRDLYRLRRWRELEPERGEPVTGAFSVLGPGVAELGPRSAAERITAERPALARITVERARLIEEPLWRRFIRRLPEPRHPMVIAAGAFLVGAAIFLGSIQLLESGDDGGGGAAPPPPGSSVTVLNGSDLPGLGGRVGDDVRVNGYELEAVSSAPRPYSQTVVMYAPGRERDAQRLARRLGVKPVQPIDRAAAKLAEGAELVIIAGDDRVG